MPQTPVKSLNKGIPGRLTEPDVLDEHTIGLAPRHKDAAKELGAVVDP